MYTHHILAMFDIIEVIALIFMPKFSILSFEVFTIEIIIFWSPVLRHSVITQRDIMGKFNISFGMDYKLLPLLLLFLLLLLLLLLLFLFL
jgi:hypothetical protein